MPIEKTEYLVMQPDGTESRHFARLPARPGFHILNKVILPHLDHQFFEHVSVLHNGQRLDMFVDEMGAMKPLPRNEVATTIYRTASRVRYPSKPAEMFPAIYGPAVLFLRRVWF